MLINAQGLNFQDVFPQTLPQEGPKAIPILLDFSGSTTEYDLDMLIPIQQNRISQIQSIYIDLSNSSDSLEVIIEGSNQTIVAKGDTQGYYQVLVPNPAKLKFIGTADTVQVQVILINIPMPGVVWSTS